MEDNKKSPPVTRTASKLCKDINVLISFENISELKVLLQKATDQLEQLEKTLIEINQFEVISKTSKI